MNISSDSEHNPHGGGNPYDLEIALEQEVLVTSVGWANSYYSHGDYIDEWGIGWHSTGYNTPFGNGRYAIKKEFGEKLCFWGTMDEQHILPFGTPEDVRKEVNLTIKNIGREGRLIIGPTQHIQLDTPMENFWAMLNTIKKD